MSANEFRTLKCPIKVTYDSENLTAHEFLYKRIRTLGSFNAEWMVSNSTYFQLVYSWYLELKLVIASDWRNNAWKIQV